MLLWQTHEAVLAHEADFDGFRRAARHHLALGTAPGELAFTVDAEREVAVPDLPGGPAHATATSPITLGAQTLALLQHAALHAEPSRFELMYRLLWRAREQPALLHDPLDADRLRLATMAQAVRREQHKMKAFVRFRPVAQPGQAAPLHVAWFEPEHHVLEAVAPFFVRRFAGMRFSILTPRRCLRWDGLALSWAPGCTREQAPPPDAGEALWLAYYAHIFNPARLKLAAMENEMPRRFWRNLPEATLIAPLAAQAAPRSAQMQHRAGTVAQRRIPPGARAADAPGHAARAAAVAPLPRVLPAAAAAREQLLRERRALAAHCRACPLGERATQTVHGRGPVGARLMFVGEQPGDQEDLRGEAFIGPAGQLLGRALQALGLQRDAVYLTNAVKHFKYELRGKRRLHKTAAQQEALACRHWLEEEIALVQPQAIVALGGTAATALLERAVRVLEDRGRWFQHASATPVLVTLHPAAILRAPEAEREAAFAAWLADLQRVL
jgi:uracil-DNA glycosylase